MRDSRNEFARSGRLAGWMSGLMAGLLLTLGASPAWAKKPEKGATAAMAMPAGPYSQYTLQEGYNWRLVQSSGYAEDGRYFSEPMYMIQDVNGLYNAPIPESVRQDLLNSVDSESTAFALSQNILNEIAISEQQGYLTPALQAIAEPMDYYDDGTGPDPYDPYDPYEPVPYEPVPYEQQARLFGRCDDKVINKSQSFNISTPLNSSFGTGGSFSGNISLTGNAQATATGDIRVRLKRFKIFGVCIPDGVRFDYAHAYGNAVVNYGTTLSGSVNYATSQPWEWQIAKPFLFSFAFFIGPIPVYVGFNLPITAGLSLSASASGSITYNGAQAATGSFDYTCTLDGCSGWSSFSSSNLQAPTTLSGHVTGRIQPTLYAQLAIRGYLYDEGFAYAQVGVRPYLYGDLWGYYGNQCGDADGDGIFETVDALTFDLDWQVYVTAQADSFLTSEKRWNLWNNSRGHLNFWDLLSSGSRAVQPMLLGSATVPANVAQTYSARMRPCWPYGDTVNYQLGWGDGSTSYPSGAPASPVSVSHAWSSTGAKGLSLIARNDSHGRQFNKTTSRTIQVTTGGGTATHYGMTWKVRQTNGAYVNVGTDSITNAYNGDTSPSTSLPILCLYKDGRAAPSGITLDFYNGWAGGVVKLSAPVAGSMLTSRGAADTICSNTFGAGYRMAEFHDGNGGWGFWAQGTLSTTTRFWVAINDQPANPWN
ncbi:hypothetical protein JRI60_00355 [Archangium violaceum]|uniref:hypothetical protein n=1 Tax=Archangium violaceum TaxID=83451 RepID=UPI001951E6E9|nr:hypothetical protein [Archangium violaceum]QRN97582.1 hypothetical protein JRI60_00355 [Archangium violaceum]